MAIIAEVQIDFEKVTDARVMEIWVKHNLKLNCIVSDNPVMLSIYDVPEESMAAIKRHCAIDGAAKGAVRVINTVRDAVVTAADFAANHIVGPVGQAVIEGGAKLGKVGLKTLGETAATFVGTGLENTRQAKAELAVSPRVIHAQQEVEIAANAIKSLFGFGSTSSSDKIREIR